MNNFLPSVRDPVLSATETCGLVKKEATVFAAINAAIVEQRLLPGTRLIEEELCAIYDVSRMRIRRVLLALAHTGLIALPPGRGAHVARPSADESRAVFATRLLIEGALLETPERFPDRSSIKQLRDLVRREDAAMRSRDRTATIQLSGAFHVDLALACGNPITADIVLGLVRRTSLIIALFQRVGAVCCRSDDHARLIDAVEDKHLVQASGLMRLHLQTIQAGLSFDARPSPKPSLRDMLTLSPETAV